MPDWNIREWKTSTCLFMCRRYVVETGWSFNLVVFYQDLMSNLWTVYANLCLSSMSLLFPPCWSLCPSIAPIFLSIHPSMLLCLLQTLLSHTMPLLPSDVSFLCHCPLPCHLPYPYTQHIHPMQILCIIFTSVALTVILWPHLPSIYLPMPPTSYSLYVPQYPPMLACSPLLCLLPLPCCLMVPFTSTPSSITSITCCSSYTPSYAFYALWLTPMSILCPIPLLYPLCVHLGSFLYHPCPFPCSLLCPSYSPYDPYYVLMPLWTYSDQLRLPNNHSITTGIEPNFICICPCFPS